MELKETESEGVSGEVGEDMEEWGVRSLKGGAEGKSVVSHAVMCR